MFRSFKTTLVCLGLTLLTAELSITLAGLFHPRVDQIYYDYFIGRSTLCLLSGNIAAQGEADLRVSKIKVSKLGPHAACFMLRDAWSSIEPWGVWSDGKIASLALPVTGAGKSLTISLMATSPSSTQTIDVYINNIFYQRFTIPDGTVTKLHVDLPANAGGVARLSFHIAHPVSPASQGASNDSRLLGIGLIEVDWG